MLQMHPFGTTAHLNCEDDKIDKLLIWEPSLTLNGIKPMCLCLNSSERAWQPTQLTSLTENMMLEMQVDPSYSSSNYFKANFSLFEASYKFVHGPLCGPPIIKSSPDGELLFPYKDALGFIEPPRSIHCIWDIQVNKDRDLSLYFEKVKFVTRDCQDGRLEIYLPSYRNPYMSVCGHNVSALKNIRVITSEEITPKVAINPSRFVQIHFLGLTTPSRAAIKVVWNELFHLTRNSSYSD